VRIGNPLLAFPARLVLPIVLSLLAVIALGILYWVQMGVLEREVEHAERLRLAERLTLEQTRLESQSEHGTPLQIRRLVSSLALHRGLSHAWLVDANGQIRASLSRSELGQPMLAHLPLLAPETRLAVAKALARRTPQASIQRLEAEQALLGVVAVGPSDTLIVRVDLAQPLASRLEASRLDFIAGAAAWLAFALLAGLITHLLWFRRAALLTRTAATLATGDLSARTRLQGADELANVGAALDAMAERLEAQHLQLHRLGTIIDHSPVIAISWANAPGWPATFVSSNIRRWGYKPEDFTAGTLHYSTLIHADDLPRITDDVASHFAHGPDAYTQNYRLRMANGQWIHIEDHTWLTRDANGEVVRIQGMLLDVSARAALAEALHDNEQRLRLALAAANQGLYDLDLRTGHAQVSPEYATMMGYDPATFVETNAAWRARLHPDDAERVFRTFEDYVAGRLPEYRVEFRQRTRDGRWKWILSLGRIEQWSADGTPLRLLGTHTDIDAIKAAEAALREANASLEARVAERTAELQALNQSLESFVYSVSHDLKAPLRGVEGYSRLLEEDYAARLDDEGQLFITNIRSGVTRMGELIDDLLEYSRMERRSLNLGTLDPAELVRQLLAARRDEFDTKGIHVHTAMPALEVIADPNGLGMALRNLLENAVKFSRNVPEPRIDIGARSEDGMAVMWVRDNGIGFDMKYHDRIFEIFQRLHRVEDYPGTGIGLALVRKAMQRMNGRAWADSSPGAGATFYLALPLAPTPTSAEA